MMMLARVPEAEAQRLNDNFLDNVIFQDHAAERTRIQDANTCN
jgi:hypothetical protein